MTSRKRSSRSLALWVVPAALAAGCGGSTPPLPPPVSSTPPPPSGPTRTDFGTIARKLVGRCVMGGWIERWRSTHPDAEVVKPRIRLESFADETGQDIGTGYLRSILEERLRLSGVFEVVPDSSRADFVARGRLERLAERVGGERVSVYTALLVIGEPSGGQQVRQCEATVRGEM